MTSGLRSKPMTSWPAWRSRVAHVAAHLAQTDESDVHRFLPDDGRVLARRPGGMASRPAGPASARSGSCRRRCAVRLGLARAAPAGLLGWVNDSRAYGVPSAPRPSSRNCGLKAISISSPVSEASIASEAWASSPWPASMTTWPSVNRSRTGVLRSATRATRLTASISVAVSMTASVSDAGGEDRRRPSGTRRRAAATVVRRWPASKPIRPSPAPDRPSASSTRAASAERPRRLGQRAGRDERDARRRRWPRASSRARACASR